MNQEYRNRIDRVITYIEEHFSQKLTLDNLAQIASFSKYHFSRIFTSIVGVTPVVFLTRIRLEKAVSYLGNSDLAILQISLLCGFESLSSFNAAFKKYFNSTPSEIRNDLIKNCNYSNYSLVDRNKNEEAANPNRYAEGSNNNFLRRIWNMKISIHELPNYEVAYVRHVGSYLDTYHAWGKIGEWAAKNGLFPPDQYFIGISLDDPSTVDEFECRYDACVTLPPDFRKEYNTGENNSDHLGDIEFATLPGGTYALYSFYDKADQLAIAYSSLFGQWLPNSQYDPDDRYCLEFCMNDPATDPEGKCKVDLYVPIRERG
ncbi:Bifunctional transcriptional activator/DNA repair enzyme AdaA [compost metagenome]